MRRNGTARALTITELLVVVSLLTILTSILSPFVLSVKHAALGRLCAHNLRQCYVGAQMYANDTFGRLPSCVELSGGSWNAPISESRWWYHKIASKIYTAKKPDGTPLNNPVAGGYIPADQCALRCPGSTDPYDQTRVSGGYTKVSGNNSDKDRVFDDNYGYNNFGFVYGDGTSNQCALPNPATLAWGSRGLSAYYHTWGAITGGTHVKHVQGTTGSPPPCAVCNKAWPCDKANKCTCGAAWPCPLATYCRLGDYSQVPEAARTLMMMDYAKADVAPKLSSPQNDGLYGYRFRHDGRANAMFVDGHVQVYDSRTFLEGAGWCEPDQAKWGTPTAPDPVTQRGRIHWAVLRP